MTTQTTELTCTCGQAGLTVHDGPIVSAECLCTDCQTAGAFLQSLPVAGQFAICCNTPMQDLQTTLREAS